MINEGGILRLGVAVHLSSHIRRAERESYRVTDVVGLSSGIPAETVQLAAAVLAVSVTVLAAARTKAESDQRALQCSSSSQCTKRSCNVRLKPKKRSHKRRKALLYAAAEGVE